MLCDDVKTGVLTVSRDQARGNLLTAWVASGTTVAGTRSWLLCGTWEPVALMSREKPKWRPHKGESSDAGHRDGATRSRDDVSAREMERRGCVDLLYDGVNPFMGGAVG